MENDRNVRNVTVFGDFSSFVRNVTVFGDFSSFVKFAEKPTVLRSVLAIKLRGKTVVSQWWCHSGVISGGFHQTGIKNGPLYPKEAW